MPWNRAKDRQPKAATALVLAKLWRRSRMRTSPRSAFSRVRAKGNETDAQESQEFSRHGVVGGSR